MAIAISKLPFRRVLSVAFLGVAMATSSLGCAASTGGDTGDEETSADAIDEASSPITNFHVVRKGLWRGAHPDAAGVAYLKKQGVRTIINLEATGLFESSGKDIDAERAEAEKLGIKFVYKPTSSFLPVNGKQMDSVLAILADKTQQPVYVHCKHGEDRTGLVIGLERVEQEKWAPKDAYQEMLDLHFHKILVALNHYFEERTGFED
jgi:protein tyrosine/serine phosphatase